MYMDSKESISCPVCGATAKIFGHTHYLCSKCDWDSMVNTIDISYADPESASLSNLYPHPFTFYMEDGDYAECASMESFIQSLRVSDPKLQKEICKNYSGYAAYKLRLSLNDWRKEGIVYWNGRAIYRQSDAYTELITKAYDCLFEGNEVFRKLVLPHFKGKHLIHSIGCNTECETLLTPKEYLFQLRRLMERKDFD